jgi:hypothetical protein
MVIESGIGVDDCRAALEKVLDSAVFSGSRRLSDFCAYAAKAALEGRTELDQYEIADKVLGRATDFNPWDDATVRKLATQLRHKLEEYYAGPGATDRIIVSLPRRSYVLRFRRREEREDEVAPEPLKAVSAESPVVVTESVHTSKFARLPAWGWLAIGMLAGSAPFVVWMLTTRSSLVHGSSLEPPVNAFARIAIDTKRGDMRGPDLDIAPGAVRTGVEIADGEEATVRLRFTPEYPAQQAGLMAMYDANNYVRVGPHFKNRTFLEFGFEVGGIYQGPTSTYAFDPMGEQGVPRWLALRRTGFDYTAYESLDGFKWSPFGARLTLPDRKGAPASAVYAFNGRSSKPSAKAVFDHFGVAVAFHDRTPGPFRAAEFAGWAERGDCKMPISAELLDNVLQVGFAPQAIGCSWSFTRKAPPGDWAFAALVDFEAFSGSSLGVTVRGSKGNTSLSRRDLDGQSLQLQQLNDRDSRIPDFPGAPPVILRVEKRGALIRAGVSRDAATFVPIPGEVSVNDLGEIERVGITTSIAHWTTQGSRPPARIYWMQLESLPPGFLSGGNVPSRPGT